MPYILWKRDILMMQINLINAATHINNLRLFPRLTLLFFAYLLIKVVEWAVNLEAISTQQTSFVSIFVGGFSAVLGLYYNSGSIQQLNTNHAMKEQNPQETPKGTEKPKTPQVSGDGNPMGGDTSGSNKITLTYGVESLPIAKER
jgi:hypothetical protein